MNKREEKGKVRCTYNREVIDCFSRGCGVQRRTVCDAEVDADTTPAIITVAGNADLHRERQRAIKVHGFHGESQHLFLAFLLTFFFH